MTARKRAGSRLTGIFAAGLLWLGGIAMAQEEAKSPFADVEMTPAPATYVVIKDANVRAGPATKAKRLSKLKKGARVGAKGRAKGTEWIAVTQDGKDLGFVYKTVVTPIIDGKVDKELTGKLSAKGQPECSYNVSFEGENNIEGEQQVTADYAVAYVCTLDSKPLKFEGTMFITEFPYLDLTKAEYQVNVDILGVPNEDEDVFSVISIYRPEKKQLSYDDVTNPEFGSGAKIEPRSVGNVQEALQGALEIAHRAWGPTLWAELKRR